MRLVPVSPTKYYSVIVPGGWRAKVPTIQIARDDERFQEMISFFMHHGASSLQAEKLSWRACQELFEGSWVTKEKMFLGRVAEIWRKTHGSLEGFRPEDFDLDFLPGSNKFYRGKANTTLRRKVMEMGRR